MPSRRSPVGERIGTTSPRPHRDFAPDLRACGGWVGAHPAYNVVVALAAPLLPASVLPGQSTLIRHQGRLVLTVRGWLSWHDGSAMAERLAALVDGEPVELVADFSEMEGYDRSAREMWQEALAGQRPLVTRMWIVGAAPMLRVAASGVALHARIPMTFIDTLADLPPIR